MKSIAIRANGSCEGTDSSSSPSFRAVIFNRGSQPSCLRLSRPLLKLAPALSTKAVRKLTSANRSVLVNGKGQAAVEHAIESGYRHLDCAFMYQNEDTIGDAILKKIEDGTVKREDLFITGKLFCPFHDPKDIHDSCMTSLKALKTDYLDLYLIHHPSAYQNNGEPNAKNFSDIDYVETWKAMETLVEKGLVRNIGVSNFNEFQIQRILKEGSVVPAVNQIESHPYMNERSLVEFCQRHNIIVTAYSPLGCYNFPGRKWNRNDILLEDPTLQEIATRMKKTVAQVVLRFQIQRNVVVIPKSVTPRRIEENIELFDFELSEKDMEAIYGLDRKMRICSWHELGFDLRKHKYYPFVENYTETVA